MATETKQELTFAIDDAANTSPPTDDTINDPAPIPAINVRSNLYFIYNNNKMDGPYTTIQIQTLYVNKKFKGNKIYIKKANGAEHWTKLQFPLECESMEECETLNPEIKDKYPDLWRNFVINIYLKKLEQVIVPQDIPKDEEKTSLFLLFIKLLGKILTVLILIVLILHCIPTVIISVIIFLLRSLCFKGKDKISATILFLACYGGIIISPIVMIFVILNKTDLWNEIQSWMIAYIVWGIVSYCITCSYFILNILEKDFSKISHIVFSIIGVQLDAGRVDIKELAKDFVVGFTMIFIYPSLAGLLPAAICGFIANYVLEEKFELKCSVDIKSDICFTSEYGCCDVISSHDFANSYAFIGGLASNVLAIWAIIRFCGYLLVNAFPQLSLYAQRKK